MRRRLKKKIERSGWLIFCAAMAGTLGVLHFGGPRWAANLLAATAFLVAMALMSISARKRSEGL